MKRSTNLILAMTLTGALFGGACGDDAETTADAQPGIEVPPVAVSVTNTGRDREHLASVVDDIVSLPDGWYEMAGYGTVLHVDFDVITPHYVTTSTCAIGESFGNRLPVDHADDDGVIIVDLVGSTTDYRLLPLARPLTCESDADDTLTALDELFAKRYPFFAERGIDWPTEFSAIEDAVGVDSGGFDDALAAFMVRLGDRHTAFDGLDIDPDIGVFGFAEVTTLDGLEVAIGHEFDRSIAAIEEVATDEAGSIVWGRLDADTGYLIIVAFEGISGKDDPVADRDALRTTLDRAFADLAEFDRLVVDMRFNRGGHEDLAAIAAGYFVQEPTPAYRKWAHAQPDPFVQTIEIQPQDALFGGNVVVVTSPTTAGAAEAFTLAIIEVADADVVGGPSFGAFSDAIDWVLPNGTKFTLSMENYTDLTGTNHEAKGIPVDVPAPFDQSIGAAVKHLNENSSS